MTVKPCSQESLTPLALQVCASSCRETPLCFSPHESRGFSLKCSASGKVSSPLSSGVPQQSQHKASRQAPSWLPRHRLCQSTAHKMHTENKQIWWAICRAPSTPQPWQVTHTLLWCCLGSDLQHCTGLCPSPQRLRQLPALTESQEESM